LSVAAPEAEPGTASGVAAVSHAASVSGEYGGQITRLRSQDGLSLAVRIFPAAASDRLPLLCLPGLSRNSRDFMRCGRYFSQHPSEARTVIAVDYRGRGLSDSDSNWRNYKPLVEAQDVLAATVVLGIDRAVVVGTSRGGIIAMLLGALRPALLAGVVLNDIGPVVEGTGLARIKNHLSARKAVVGTWDEAVALVRATSEGQFPALSDADWQAFAEAHFAETSAGLSPQFDSNLVKTIGDVDFTEKIPPLWPQFMSLARVPVLAIRGELSDILSERTLKEMGQRHPRFESLTVPGQGHAPLLRDQETLERMRAFVERCEISQAPISDSRVRGGTTGKRKSPA
jgi:pimeloyl-ACP methyl ester carboxylesterase